MSADSTKPQQHEAPDFRWPRVRRITFERKPSEPPRHRHFESALQAVLDAVEFIVETDRPIPTRALGPVLYVGSTPVTEVMQEDETRYRFVALHPDELRDGAMIRVGWSGESFRDCAETGFKYSASLPTPGAPEPAGAGGT